MKVTGGPTAPLARSRAEGLPVRINPALRVQPFLQPELPPFLRLLALLLLEGVFPLCCLAVKPVTPGLNFQVRPGRRHPLLHGQDFWLLREADDVDGTNACGNNDHGADVGDSEHRAASSCS